MAKDTTKTNAKAIEGTMGTAESTPKTKAGKLLQVNFVPEYKELDPLYKALDAFKSSATKTRDEANRLLCSAIWHHEKHLDAGGSAGTTLSKVVRVLIDLEFIAKAQMMNWTKQIIGNGVKDKEGKPAVRWDESKSMFIGAGKKTFNAYLTVTKKVDGKETKKVYHYSTMPFWSYDRQMNPTEFNFDKYIKNVVSRLTKGKAFDKLQPAQKQKAELIADLAQAVVNGQAVSLLRDINTKVKAEIPLPNMLPLEAMQPANMPRA